MATPRSIEDIDMDLMQVNNMLASLKLEKRILQIEREDAIGLIHDELIKIDVDDCPREGKYGKCAVKGCQYNHKHKKNV